jgi:chromosome segregation ATPase
MADNIKLLEELVVEAVERLRSLTGEREELRQRVAALGERLDALTRETSEPGTDSEAAHAWEDRRAEALSILQEALTELRGDGSAA